MDLNITFLGTGTSQGVPVIACKCAVCKSEDARDRRLRSSVLITTEDGRNYCIDAGPDFRYQMLRAKVDSLEAVVFTHEHKDHVAGLDDVRAYNYSMRKDMRVYGNRRVEEALHRDFHYAFGENTYPGVPRLAFHLIDNSPFMVDDLTFQPIEVMHFKLPVFGFRVGDFSYITDAKSIAPLEMDKIRGSRTLVLNALRQQEHISHFNLDEALAVVEELQPERAYLTHISHLMGKHGDVSKLLPSNVEIAIDGLQLKARI